MKRVSKRRVSPIQREHIEAAACSRELKLRITGSLPFLQGLDASDIRAVCDLFRITTERLNSAQEHIQLRADPPLKRVAATLIRLAHKFGESSASGILIQVFKSKAIIVGSPTINRGILTSIAGLMEEILGLGFKGKKAAAFGTYGWSGESTKRISELLERSGFAVLGEGFKVKWNPDGQAKRDAVEYGRSLAVQLSS